ncbi:MAG: hypothetical protein HC818_02165 [Synechococcaceae cyanobacterium RM1_1_27]|nr:hypothetical protein [Synechococcaceae cyanobacterium SM2_3_2]NJO85614.1 hypothetical protein [Synechococcaceae cyanobacterium RM1_1_27]
MPPTPSGDPEATSKEMSAKDIKIKLAQLVTHYGPAPLLNALSDLAWERSQPGLPQSGQWRRIFMALQDVVLASQDPDETLQ